MTLQQTLAAKLQEAERVSAQIRQLETDSEEQKEAIFRWAVLGDEVKKMIIQTEEQLSAAQLARVKAEVNGAGPTDLWAKYVRRVGTHEIPVEHGRGREQDL